MLKVTIEEGENSDLIIKNIKEIGDWWSAGMYRLTKDIEWLVIPNSGIFDIQRYYNSSKGSYNGFYIPVIKRIMNWLKNKGNILWEYFQY